MLLRIIASRLTGSLSYYSLIPFLALYAIKVKGIGSADAALIVSVLLFSGRLLSLLSSFLIARFPLKRILVLAYLICAAFCILMMLLSSFYSLLIIAVVIGSSFAVCSIVSKVYIASSTEEGNILKIFGYLKLVVNVSSALGVVLAGQVAGRLLNLLPLLSAIMLFCSALLVINMKETATTFMKGKKIPHQKASQSLDSSESKKGFFRLTFLLLASSMTPWVLYGFFFNAVVYQVSIYGGSTKGVSLLFTLNAFIIIIFQVLTVHIMEKIAKNKLIYISAINQLLLCLSFILYIPSQFKLLIVFVIAFSLFEMIWGPLNDFLSAQLSGENQKGKLIPLCNFFWGSMEALGTFIGIHWFGVFHKNQWLIIGLIMFWVLLSHSLLIRHIKKQGQISLGR